jgi:hypothetical protein
LSQSISTKIDDYKDLLNRVESKRKEEEVKKEMPAVGMSTASTGFGSTGFSGTMQIDKQQMLQN